MELEDVSTDWKPSIEGYKVLEKVSETSYAEVWHALQISLDRVVTLWILKLGASSEPGVAEHFEQVSRAVSRIRHPNFVQVIDIARLPEGVPYMVLENVEGSTLASILHMGQRLDEKRAATLVLEIAKSLDFAWKQCGFVHRNLKPETIVLGAGDSIKITNYNTATLVRPGDNPLACDGGMIVGTPNYASPEQVECLRNLDFHSDMYSLGLLFYQMVTGLVPFGEQVDPMQVIESQRSGTLDDPRKVVSTLQAGYVQILARMLAKVPEERYQWWQDVIEDLQRVLSGREPFHATETVGTHRSTIAMDPTLGVATAPAESAPAKTAGAKPMVIKPRGSKPNLKLKPRTSPSSSSSSSIIKPKKTNALGPISKVASFLIVVGVIATVAYFRIQSLEGGKSKAGAGAPKDAGQFEPLGGGMQTGYPDGTSSEGMQSDDPMGADGMPGEGMADASSGSAEMDYNQSGTDATNTNATQPKAGSGNPQKDLINQLFLAVRRQPLPKVVALADQLIQENGKRPGVNTKECETLLAALKAAMPYDDMLGHALASSFGVRTFQYEGKEISYSVKGYAEGYLRGSVNLPDGKQKPLNVKVADISLKQKYELLLTTVESKRKENLYSRALFLMKMGDMGGFSRLVDKYQIQELKPFMEYAGK